jgi:Na+/proline symporter
MKSRIIKKLHLDELKEKTNSSKIKKEIKEFWKRFRTNMATLIISAFGLVTALSWNDAIKCMITSLLPPRDELTYKFYAAVVVTLIAVVATYFISKLKPEE